MSLNIFSARAMRLTVCALKAQVNQGISAETKSQNVLVLLRNSHKLVEESKEDDRGSDDIETEALKILVQTLDNYVGPEGKVSSPTAFKDICNDIINALGTS